MIKNLACDLRSNLYPVLDEIWRLSFPEEENVFEKGCNDLKCMYSWQELPFLEGNIVFTFN